MVTYIFSYALLSAGLCYQHYLCTLRVCRNGVSVGVIVSSHACPWEQRDSNPHYTLLNSGRVTPGETEHICTVVACNGLWSHFIPI